MSPQLLAAAEGRGLPADLAIMIHTSGSCADPKGAAHPRHAGAPDLDMAGGHPRRHRGDGPATVLCAMPFFWVGGVLCDGALHEPIILLVLARLDAGTALDLIETERATGVIGWPAFTQQLREHPSFARRDLSSVPTLRDRPLDIAMTDVSPTDTCVPHHVRRDRRRFMHTDMRIVDDDGPAGCRRDRRRAVDRRHRRDGRVQQAGALGRRSTPTVGITGDQVYRRPDDQ